MAIKIAGVDVINDDRELVLAKLTDINETISSTAVDVFIYDTSKDSDGGAWRHRTQHTSWYAEASSASRDVNTRSTRAEFPAVAVIVAESDKVTIYDGDDPSLPMWMVFNEGGANALWSNSAIYPTSVAMLNGIMCVGQGNGVAGFNRMFFVEDTTSLMIETTVKYNAMTIADRNRGGSLTVDGTFTAGLVNRTINDVAMTVLPNAPTDPATGLPVPTIAVATDGGVSVIKDDGTVVDIATANLDKAVSFTGDRLLAAYSSYGFRIDDIPTADTTDATWGADDRYGVSLTFDKLQLMSGATTAAITNNNDLYQGSALGLSSVYEDPTTPANGMVAYVTSSYNSGYQNGDIKLAALADTTAETLSGSAINDTTDFTTDWVALQSGWTINTTSLVCDGVGSADLAYFDFSDAGSSLGIGDFATIRFTVSSYTSGSLFVSFSNGAATTPAITSTGDYEFVQQVTANDILYLRSQNFAGTITSVEITAADPDRSVNGNGLGVHGSITKAAVATGADVVAYSGFSASNYLEQPYNADLDFGAGDFCVMGWGKSSAASSNTYISYGTTGGVWQLQHDGSGNLNGYLSGLKVTHANINDGSWKYIALVRSSGTVYLYVNGSLVDSASAVANVTTADATLRLGFRQGDINPFTNGSLALWRISATAPTADQIAKIYEDEKVLFQENAKATLYGSSDAVTALAHDPVTDLLHVGTSSGRSVFQGLRRVEESTGTDSQSLVAISAVDGLVVEGK